MNAETSRMEIDWVRALWQRRLWLVLAMFVGVAGGFVVAFFTDKAWRSEVQLVIAKSDEENGALSGLGGELGGLSTLAGIAPMDAVRTEYMATLKSNGLVRDFFQQGTVTLDFCRGKVIDCKLAAGQKVVSDDMFYRIVRKFQRSVLSVEDDKLTGLIKVSVTWVDRDLAAQWANGMVATANQRLEDRAIRDAKSRLNYLTDAVRKTDLVPLQDAISHLMEGQVKSQMLAETRPEYAFRVIDPARPAAAFDYVKPRRAVMMAAGMALGFLLVAVWTAIQPPRLRKV